MGFPGGSDVKESACNAGDLGSIPGSERSPGEWNGPTPVFLPGEFHIQRSLEATVHWGHKELDTSLNSYTLYIIFKKIQKVPFYLLATQESFQKN